MTLPQHIQSRDRMSDVRFPRRSVSGSNLFWILLAPFCSLLDSRFRRYANSRDVTDEGEWLNTCLRLPDAKSCTSWAARKSTARSFSLSPDAGAQVSDTRLS